MADAGAAKEMVEARHIAAVLTPEKGRAPVLNKDIAALSERMKREGGKSVFQAEVSEKPEDTMVNFDQMRRVLGDEKKRVDAESDPAKKAELQKHYDRMAMRVDEYDKLLNNEGYKALTPDEKKDMAKIMTSLPGFSEAISLATGGRLTIAQVNKFLSGGGGVLLNAQERSAVNAIVEQFANSDKLHARLAKSLAGLTVPPEDATLQNEIEGLRTDVAKKGDLQRKKTDLEEKIDKYKGLTSTERATADDYKARINDDLRGITEARFKPSVMNSGNIASKITLLESEVTDLQAQATALQAAATNPATRNPDISREYNQLNTNIRQLNSTKQLLKDLQDIYSDPAATKLIKVADDYSTAKTDMTEVDKGLSDISAKERQIIEKEALRSQYADKYKRKMETTLPDEMKRFWNDVVITNAVQAANAEIMMKEEKATGEKSEQQKREDTAKGILDKYLKLSYLKYKNGKVDGWDDKAIKDFMHKDMLSRSPGRLTRDMLERVYYKSGDMPEAYRKEIKSLLAEMGVGKGNPPLSLRDALNKIPQSWYDSMAAEKVPDMLGYAWGRGYYFDTMKLKGGEAEFLRQAYPPEFFEKAYASREAEFDAAQKMLDDHILGGGTVVKEDLKKIFGKDWTQGLRRGMKVAAVAGAIGAGIYGGVTFLGGSAGFDGGVATLQGVAEAGRHALGAASAIATEGVRKGANWVTNAAADFEVAHAADLTATATRDVTVEIAKAAKARGVP